jgi:hypothetical protein
MGIKLTEWADANAMVDGWGYELGEIHCRECTQQMIDEYFEEYADENPSIEDYMEGAHRGGFVPAFVDSDTCSLCDKEIA